MFVLQVAESTRTAIEGLASEPLDVDAGTSKFDLTLSLTERDKNLLDLSSTVRIYSIIRPSSGWSAISDSTGRYC
jgi:hypothetical protein